MTSPKSNTTKNEPQNNFLEETKDSSLRPLSKFEYDLYKEEDDITLPVIRVKRTSTSNKIEKWKIFENNTAVFVIEGAKLSSKEKEFLRTPDGFNFLISQYRAGIKSFNSLKISIKKKIK